MEAAIDQGLLIRTFQTVQKGAMSVEILGQQAMETRWVVLIEIQTKGRATQTLEITMETVKIVLVATITEEDLNNPYGVI
jgi:hypothetical protein